jgi:cytochrome c oxidase cbb3-type subunit 4
MELSILLQQIADNATLVWMFGFFVAMVLFVFRPGSRAIHADAAQVPLRERDDLSEPSAEPMQCPNACPACTCASGAAFLGEAK